jgi:hypothetical protein
MKRSFLSAGMIMLGIILLISCQTRPVREEVHMPSRNYHFVEIPFDSLKLKQKVYVPIYSDIYHGSGLKRFLLTATLSLRNTSMRDTLYIRRVDYFDSEGNLNRTYLDRTIELVPLGSVEFVVEDKEMHGGAGANFIVSWVTDHPEITPVFQAVMIGTAEQQGISFLTDGIVIESTCRD